MKLALCVSETSTSSNATAPLSVWTAVPSFGSPSGSSETLPLASVPPESIVGASLVPLTVTVRVAVSDPVPSVAV